MEAWCRVAGTACGRQTVELNNERSLPAKYEFLLPNADDPVHRRIQLDVDAQGRLGAVSLPSQTPPALALHSSACAHCPAPPPW